MTSPIVLMPNILNDYALLYSYIFKMADITGSSNISTFWTLSFRATENVLSDFTHGQSKKFEDNITKPLYKREKYCIVHNW